MLTKLSIDDTLVEEARRIGHHDPKYDYKSERKSRL
jgi:hypothetical protein